MKMNFRGGLERNKCRNYQLLPHPISQLHNIGARQVKRQPLSSLFAVQAGDDLHFVSQIRK